MSADQIFGFVFLFLGFLDLLIYIAHFAGVKLPLSFWKLKPMQERWGKVPGTILHFTGYVIVPIVFGAMLLLGYSGFSK